MTHKEAASVIQAMRQSLTTNPGQFIIDITVTGQTNISRSGTALAVTATGGAAGSTTIGQVVSVSNSDVGIQQGTKAFDSRLDALVSTLGTIADELMTPSPDSSKLKRLRDSLVGTWVPGVITSVIANVLWAALSI